MLKASQATGLFSNTLDRWEGEQKRNQNFPFIQFLSNLKLSNEKIFV